MMRDAEELPVILAELEDASRAVERGLYVSSTHPQILLGTDLVRSEELRSAKQVFHQYLQKHRGTLEDLEELGDIMDDMLHRQDEIEVRQCHLFLYCQSHARALVRPNVIPASTLFTRTL